MHAKNEKLFCNAVNVDYMPLTASVCVFYLSVYIYLFIYL